MNWKPIASAPKDRPMQIEGRDETGAIHRMYFGKTSHLPWVGWNYGGDVEDMNIWFPTEWREIQS